MVASAPVLEEALRPMPKALDDMPCAQCYAAPEPGAGVGAESEPRGAVPQQHHATSVADTTLPKDAGGWPPRMPVRIAFCRWLD